MARRGWVSAEVAPGTWRRLQVFDDGWVELPGFARALSDTRRNLRRALTALAVFAGAVAVGAVLDAAGAPEVLLLPCALVGLAALVWGALLATGSQLRGMAQGADDAAQARAERDAGQRLRLAPGAPRWKRADSAAQLGTWLEGASWVAAADVVEVAATPGATSRVVVRLRDGSSRTYTSPDATLVRLLEDFSGTP